MYILVFPLPDGYSVVGGLYPNGSAAAVNLKTITFIRFKTKRIAKVYKIQVVFLLPIFRVAGLWRLTTPLDCCVNPVTISLSCSLTHTNYTPTPASSPPPPSVRRLIHTKNHIMISRDSSQLIGVCFVFYLLKGGWKLFALYLYHKLWPQETPSKIFMPNCKTNKCR